MNIEDTMRDALQRDAADLVPIGPGPDDARRRSFRHRRRIQSGVVVLSALGLVGGALAIIETRPSGTGPRVAAQPIAPTSELVWRTVDGTVLNQGLHFTTADGVTYSLSTAPGATSTKETPAPQALYSTRDGVTWSQASLGATRVEDLTEGGGVLYAVSTGPGAQKSSVAYNLTSSTDGGAQWNADANPIPVEFTPIQTTLPATMSTSLHVARRAHTTVVMAKASYQVDLSSVLGNTGNYHTTSTGVDILEPSAAECKGRSVLAAGAAPSACEQKVTSTKTWAELGVANPEALHQQKALVREDGGDWQPVSVPSEADSSVVDVSATANGFLMAVQGWNKPATNVQLFSSNDGGTWTPLAGAVPQFDSVSISGDRIIGVNMSTSDMYVSNDAGGTWTATQNVALQLPGTDPVTGSTTVDAGPLGYAAVVTTGHELTNADPASPEQAKRTAVTLDPNTKRTADHAYLMNSTDGITWKVTDLAAQGAPADGFVSGLTVGLDHIDVSYIVNGTQAADGSVTNKLVELLGTPKA
jgi:hypothetical protein